MDRRPRGSGAIHHGPRARPAGGEMIFKDLMLGVPVFLDANTFLYHFTTEPRYGAACTELLERIERGETNGPCHHTRAQRSCPPADDHRSFAPLWTALRWHCSLDGAAPVGSSATD